MAGPGAYPGVRDGDADPALVHLGDVFGERFGGPPSHLSRAPGRVNLIGEHTDYNDLPVLPMALQREVKVAYRGRDDEVVRVANVSGEFAPVEFRVGPGIERSAPGHWGNYVKAPFDELARRFGIRKGLDGVVTSDLPVASGLSSSSALVNAVGIALTQVSGLALGPLELADIMAEAERYTGTRGGGMDQAVSMAADSGHATRIDFAPLRMRSIAIPSEWRIVVADTGVRAEKSGRAQEAYNARRRECEEALAHVVANVGLERSGGSDMTYPAMLDTLGFDGALAAGEAALDGKLLRRFRHVVTEARRVDQAEVALSTGDAEGFGALMIGSHDSLRDDYGVSSPELDALVACAREGGAAGARLTGAGFGGCIVALAVSDTVAGVLDAIRTGYDPGPVAGPTAGQAFVAVPSRGASVRPW